MRLPALLSHAGAWITVGLLSHAEAQIVVQKWTGAPGQSFFGRSVASLGDLDGDGHPEAAVGDPSGAGFQGQVSVYSMVTGAPRFSVFGQVPGQDFGAAVAAVGDLDDDGVPDLAVGSPLDSTGAPSAGQVSFHSGVDGALIRTLKGTEADAYFGAALAPLGDLDGDGFCDLLVGAPREGSDQRGGVWVVSGADGAALRHFAGLGKDDFLGSAVAAAGDVDGDGVMDLMAGAPESAAQAGYALVFSGADSSLLRQLNGDHPGDAFGSAVAGLDDVDGDGLSDLAVGVPGLDLGFPEAGGVLAYSGADGSLLHLHTGDGPWAGLGFSVAGLGDVDGDDIPDLAAGTDRLEGGEVRVWRGSDGAVISLVPAFDVGAEGLGSGVAAAPAGDIDGDGLADLLLGSPSRLVSADPGSARAVRLSVTPWIDLGGALAGGSGAPGLIGEGSLHPGSTYTLQLESGLPFASASLVMGFHAIHAPFKGGVLIPSPDVVHAQLGLDVAGGLTFVGQLPAGSEPGVAVVFQVWFADPGAPVGMAGSNALQATVAP